MMRKEEFISNVIPGVMILLFGIFSLIFGLGLSFFHGQPIYFEIIKLLIFIAGLIYITTSLFLFRSKMMFIFGIFSLIFGLGLFYHGMMNIYIYNGYFILLTGYSIVAILFLFRSKIMFPFGIFSLIFGLGLFLFHRQSTYLIEKLLIFITGLIYVVVSFYLFKSNNWSERLVLSCSIILLSYFVFLSLYLISDPWGWGGLIAALFLPYILFPLFFIIFLTRPKVKELFKK